MAFNSKGNCDYRSKVLGIMSLLIISLASISGYAQDDKEEIKVGGETVVKETRKKVQTSKAPVKVFVSEKKIQSVKLLDESIVRLKRLIDRMPEDHRDRPQTLFNLAEAYWSKSKSYEKKAFSKQDECFALADKGEKGRSESCKTTMGKFLQESKKLRKSNIELYAEIIRNYPTFKRLDKVYFFLGTSFMETGEKKKGLDVFKLLIADYPQSSYLPNVLLAFGDYFFDKDDMESALQAYKRVRKYKKSSVYAYARYKEGWCYFNLEKKEKALDTFMESMKIAKKSPKVGSHKSIIKQARKDIVLAYSHFGAPGKAIPFFKKLAGNDKNEWLGMGERLGLLYADKGNPSSSNALFKELIRLNKESIKVIDYQQEIVRNTTQINSYNQDSVSELVRLAKLVKYADDGKFKDINQAKWKKKRTQVEVQLRRWAVTYHREAQKTKTADIYAMAYFLYKYYLEAFQNSPKEYEMVFFYGELLYKLQKWEEAAAAYDRVVTIKPKGPYTNEAVHGLVLSYFKVVSVSEEQKNLNKRAEEILESTEKDKEGKTVKAAPIPKAKPIPDKQKRLIKACEMYSELNPNGDRIVDVKYTMARIYYDYDHHKDAIKSFKDIAYNHSEHRLAVIAANLHLDSWSILQNYDGLHADVKEYLEKRPIKDQGFIEDLQRIDSNVAYKKCAVAQDAEKWKETSTCFVAFFREHGSSELVDRALYSAALAFERQKDIGKAIQVRKFLLIERPDSKYAPVTLYNIGGNYHALAIYSEAAKFYEIYASTYPKKENAEVALSNAATFRHGLGEYDKAISDFETYLRKFGKRDPAKAAEFYFLIGEIYELQGKRKKAFDQYNSYIRKIGKKDSHDHYMKSHIKIAKYYDSLRGKSNDAKAQSWYKKTLKAFAKFGKSDQEKMKGGRDAAAEARFKQGEVVFREMAKIKINSPNEKKLKKDLKLKQAKLAQAEKIFKSVIEFGRPDWTIAAFYRIGAGYHNAANTIRTSFIPKRLTYDQKEIYRGVLEDAATKIDNTAVSAFTGALEIAQKKNWFNEFSKKAEIALAELRPRLFKKPSEKRAEPNQMSHGFNRSAFVTAVEDEDRLTDLNSSKGQ